MCIRDSINSPLKLDLNGKTAAKLTVTGDATLASLLPEGYAFKSGSTWISDLTGTELTKVSMAKIPIKGMDYPTEMSMEYGGTGTLLVSSVPVDVYKRQSRLSGLLCGRCGSLCLQGNRAGNAPDGSCGRH